jgi:hypothetical protein
MWRGNHQTDWTWLLNNKLTGKQRPGLHSETDQFAHAFSHQIFCLVANNYTFITKLNYLRFRYLTQ